MLWLFTGLLTLNSIASASHIHIADEHHCTGHHTIDQHVSGQYLSGQHCPGNQGSAATDHNPANAHCSLCLMADMGKCYLAVTDITCHQLITTPTASLFRTRRLNPFQANFEARGPPLPA
ncbi:hypothetical protein ACVBEJ_13005 [Porticoccus sp. GXU_MW_L64]